MFEDVEQPAGRAARVAALVLEMFDLFDGDAKPMRQLGLGHACGLAQGLNATGTPLHAITEGTAFPHLLAQCWVTKFAENCNTESRAGPDSLTMMQCFVSLGAQ